MDGSSAGAKPGTEMSVEDIKDREIVVSRVFDAPRELVWDAWTKPENVARWWGPKGFTTTIHEMDVRPGGVWRHTMHGPDGTDYPNKSTFLEVVKPERIVYTHGGGKKGERGVNFEATWTFEAEDNKTRLTIRQLFPSVEMRDHVVKTYHAIEGANQTLGRLAEDLAKTPVVVERSLGAPIETVWRALTDLAQMKQWYFPMLESFKPEVGFETQFNVRMEGKDYLHIWKVTEVVPGKKITYSWKYGGFPGDTLLTFELFSEGNKTRIRLTHTGLQTFEPETNPELVRGNFEKGWTHFGDALKKFAEGTPVQNKEMPRKELTLTRIFDAPRELVWKAWTDPKHLARWWGPAGFTNPICEADARVGGAFRIVMRSPDGVDFPCGGEYREVIAPERLVFTNIATDSDGKKVLDGLTTVIFADQGGKTKLTLETSAAALVDYAAEYLKGMEAGWTQSLQRLAEQLVRW
jgi:uncharacterized protein YndB with AHSA1/START domain